MKKRAYGASDMMLGVLGFGAGHLGGPHLDQAQVDRLLELIVDSGVSLIDTAPSYGESEARIGRGLARLRARVVVSTKVGYGVPGVPDWTGPCITGGIEQALEKLQTDYLDIVHLHSCPRQVLERGDVIEALQNSKTSGKLRFAAYSGDGEALEWAIDSGAFDGVQCSYNLVDRAAATAIRRAKERGLGVIVKRPLANAVWRFDERPEAFDLGTYWDRWRTLHYGIAQAELALPFALSIEGATCAIVGTSNPRHVRLAVEQARTTLPEVQLEQLDRDYAPHAAGWPGLI